MTTYFKATRPDGTSSQGDPPVAYVRKDGSPRTGVIRPNPFSGMPELCGPGTLHVADVPTQTLAVGSWPCRLFEVEAAGDLVGQEGCKFGFTGLRILRELPAWEALGPNGAHVAALITQAERLTAEQISNLAKQTPQPAAWDAAWVAARGAARGAARAAAWDAAWGAAHRAARDAPQDMARNRAWATAWDVAPVAVSLVVRDLIGGTFTQAHYDLLTRQWRTVIGPIHPDDPEITP